MIASLVMHDVYKMYGKKVALEHIELELESGMIMGLVGGSQSGKTTLLELIMGLIKADKGSIEIAGSPVSKLTKKDVAYLPKDNHLYAWMTIKEAIHFFKKVYKNFETQKAEELLKDLALERKIATLSHDELMLVKFALTVSRNTKIYLFDEPFLGVTPLVQKQMGQWLIKNYTEDKTVIIATSNLQTVEGLLNYVTFLKDGKIILKGETDLLIEDRGQSLYEIYKEVVSNVRVS
ncbi:ATP-binding cassette domain-containing protein [Cellulosilyticum ruminicola]|uniref:ATP-binding cassette domain-containing protein n=1 Tax=Cellulosilyticum ruminicola TaxID=425254 RepID=UPI0006D03141|nr:ABC transporter ATP-binding protein [Cellulosilyticum ruminicola]